jgi:hypothetical protein
MRLQLWQAGLFAVLAIHMTLTSAVEEGDPELKALLVRAA